jgi:hypothetical protein
VPTLKLLKINEMTVFLNEGIFVGGGLERGFGEDGFAKKPR